MFINARKNTKRDKFKSTGLEDVMATKQGKASSMTTGAGSGEGRLQKAGMKTKFATGGTVGSVSGDGAGKSRGGGAAVKGFKFKGVF